MKKTAIIAGATGLVGEHLLRKLLENDDYDAVIAILRKPLPEHPKLEQKIIDFELLPEILAGTRADEGFCCLGTTLKSAGSKERQYRIDHDYVINFAAGCLVAGVKRFSVVSSIGADDSSSNFYLRTKGEMERDLKKIQLKNLVIVRPSLLMGNRREFRAAEAVANSVMKVINPLFIGGLKKYRGVMASDVATCMIRNMNIDNQGITIINSDQIQS